MSPREERIADRVYCPQHKRNSQVDCNTCNKCFFANQRADIVDAKCHYMLEEQRIAIEGLLEEDLIGDNPKPPTTSDVM